MTIKPATEWNLYHVEGIHAGKLAGSVWAQTKEEAEDKYQDRWGGTVEARPVERPVKQGDDD